MNAATRIAEHLRDRGPRLGTSTLVCIDGPSGSGKTTLAAELADLVPATVLHTDAYCPGWAGIPAVPALLTDLLTELAAGRTGLIREWDWHACAPGRMVPVEPAALVVIEGVGAGAVQLAPWISTLVFLDGDDEERRERALARDDYFAEHWDSWAAAERAYFADNAVRERADLIIRTC